MALSAPFSPPCCLRFRGRRMVVRGEVLPLGIPSKLFTSGFDSMALVSRRSSKLGSLGLGGARKRRQVVKAGVQLAKSEDDLLEKQGEESGRRKVVIVGGGPGGLLAAIVLLRRGFAVDLYEKYSYEPSEAANSLSYYYTMTGTGKRAIEFAGLGFPHHIAVPIKGGIQYSPNGKKSTFEFSTSDVFSIPRKNLVAWLVSAAKEVGLENFNLFTGWYLESLKDDGKVACFRKNRLDETNSANSNKVDGDDDNTDMLEVSDHLFLIGADGVNSSVRREIVKLEQLKQIPEATRLSYVRRKNDSHFKVLPGIADESIAQRLTQGAGYAVVIFRSKLSGSNLTCMPTGKCTFAVVWSAHITKTFDFSLLKDATIAEKVLREEFPLMHEIYSELGSHNFESIAKAPIGSGGTSLYCSKFNYGNILLIGDAAHSMTRSLGQGTNSAMMDSVILSQILDEFETLDEKKVEHAFQLFNEKRFEEMQTIVRLSENAYVQAGIVGSLKQIRSAVRIIVLSLAKKVFPWTPGPPFFFFEDIPYPEMEKRLNEANISTILLLLLFVSLLSSPFIVFASIST